MILFLWRCEGPRCHNARLLLARTNRGRLCSDCWRRLGEPTAAAVDPEERERRRREMVKRMQKRGGNAAYMVRSGKAGL